MTGRRIFVVLVLGFALHASAHAARYPEFGGVLRMAVTRSYEALDPLEATSPETIALVSLTYNGLFQLNAKGQARPRLASALSVSPDGKAAVLTLRDGVVFQDGSALDIKDVAYSLNRAAKDPVAGPALKNIVGYPNNLEIEPADEGKIRIGLKRPEPNLASILALPQLFIVSEGYTGKEKGSMGTGPFTLDHEGRNVLFANASHFDGRPYLDRVELKVQPTSQDRVLDYKRGLVDLLLLEPGHYGSLPGRWLKSASPSIYYLDYACKLTGTQRRLTETALDRERLLRGIFRSRGKVLGKFEDAFTPGEARLPEKQGRASVLVAALGDGMVRVSFSRVCGEACERLARSLVAALKRLGVKAVMSEPRQAHVAVRRFSPGGVNGAAALRLMERELRRCDATPERGAGGDLKTTSKTWLFNAPLYAGVTDRLPQAFLNSYGVPDLAWIWLEKP